MDPTSDDDETTTTQPTAPSGDAVQAPEAPEEKTSAATDNSNDDEMSREEFDKWLEEATNAKLSASVAKPTVVKSGMLGAQTFGYEVKCPALGSDENGVWRRYSDFEWLYNVLAARYSGTIIAPMPEKKAFNKDSPIFLAKRCRQLHAWLMLTLQNPYIKRDATVHEFLTSTQVGAEWDQLKKTALEEAGQPWLTRPHIKQWRYYLTSCLDLPNDCGEVLDGLWASVSTQLTVVASLITSLNGMDQRQRSLGTSLDKAGEKMEIMGFTSSPRAVINEEKLKSSSAGERKSSIGDETELPTDNSFVDDADVEVTGTEQTSLKTGCNEMARLFTALSAGIAGAQSAAATRAVFYRLCVNGLMQHWKAHLDEVNKVNKKLVAMVQGLTKAEMSVKRNETKVEQLREKHGLQEDVVVNCEKELEKQNGLVASYTAEYEAARKAIYHHEGEKFVQSRTRSLKRLMSQLCVLSSATHAHSAKEWGAVSAAAKQSLNTLNESTSV